MKLFTYIFSILFVTGFFNSCTDDDYTMLDGTEQAPILSLTGNTTQVLLSENAEIEALSFSWNEVNLNVNTPITYILETALGGSDFAVPTTLQNSDLTNFTMTVSQLNLLATTFEILPETQGTIDFRVIARIGTTNSHDLISETITITVTPYTDVLDLSTPWGVVGSGTPNGWNGPDVPFWKQQGSENEGIIIAYANLVDGEIKFRMNNSWDAPNINYGGNSSNGGSLVEGGPNIPITAGTYKITMNLNDLTYTIENYSWGIVGSATPNGWDGPDIPLIYDPTSDQWRALTTLADGDIKFRMNNSWNLSYGDTGLDGTLESDNGDNIPVTAGNYLITVNFNELTYTIESVEHLWGLVGSATPNSWDGPDVQLNLDYNSDYENGAGIWYANSLQLNAGELKFRADNAWDLNYGGPGLEGTLESGGANIVIPNAGFYDVVMDLSTNSYSITPN